MADIPEDGSKCFLNLEALLNSDVIMCVAVNMVWWDNIREIPREEMEPYLCLIC